MLRLNHGFPRSPTFSLRASEIDPAWPFIRLLAWLRLARPYRTIPQVAGRVTAALRPELPQVSPDFAE